MKNLFSCVLVVVLLLCSCDAKKSVDDSAFYNDCRLRYVNYVSDTTNYEDCYLSVGADGNGFVPISDKLKPIKPDDEKYSEFVDTLVMLYNTYQLLDAMIYDCSTIDRYNEVFDPEPYAAALDSIDVSGINCEEMREALLALSSAVAKDIRKGKRTDTIYYKELERVDETIDKLFVDFVVSLSTDAEYNCSEVMSDYDEVHAKAVSVESNHSRKLLQAVLREENFEKKCIYAREFAYSNRHNAKGDVVDVVAVIETLLLTNEYSPILFDLWLVWRTALQGDVFGGISNDSSMYNLYYNDMRCRVAQTYMNRLNENPHDQLAFNGLIRTIFHSNIIRNSSCPIGNNCILDQVELYGKVN